MTTVLTVQEPPIRDDEGRESDKKITDETKGGNKAINPEIVEDFGPWMLVGNESVEFHSLKATKRHWTH